MRRAAVALALAIAAAAACTRNEFVYTDPVDASAGAAGGGASGTSGSAGSAGSDADAAGTGGLGGAGGCVSDAGVDAAADCSSWCGDGVCSGDTCELPTVSKYASFLTLFNGRLLWTDAGDVWSLSPTGEQTMAVNTGDNPAGLVVECDWYYFTRTSDGSLMRADAGGGSQTALSTSLVRPAALIKDGVDFYGVSESSAGADGSIWALRGASSSPETLLGALSGTEGIALEGSEIYFSHGGGVGSCPKVGGTCEPTKVATSTEFGNWKASPVLIVDGRIFFVTPFNVHSRLLNGTQSVNHLSQGAGVTGLDVAAGDIYWTIAEAGGEIGRKPVGGGTEVTLATANTGSPVAVKADVAAGFVYWMEQLADGSSYLHKKRLP